MGIKPIKNNGIFLNPQSEQTFLDIKMYMKKELQLEITKSPLESSYLGKFCE